MPILGKSMESEIFQIPEVFQKILDNSNQFDILPNIFKNNEDFNNSANLLINSLNQKDNICILGDYEVEPSTS